jgi:hypothetical protein
MNLVRYLATSVSAVGFKSVYPGIIPCPFSLVYSKKLLIVIPSRTNIHIQLNILQASTT